MTILGIETSCDETSAAIVKGESLKDKVKLISNVIASSLSLHSKTGGIIPEVAAREQVRYIIPVVKKAILPLEVHKDLVDAIAVTVGPGLIGSLLVGIETAKTLAFLWNKPIIPVNHLIGHIYANWIENAGIEFPALSLIVSGGHTDLVLLKEHGKIRWLGGTRDDAAGEAFDKIGRLLGLSYPAGSQIEKLADEVSNDIYKFPRPLIDSNDFDFSFSGLKTAALREVQKLQTLGEEDVKNISYSLQQAIFDVLIKKTFTAAEKFNVKSILLGGGVAANQTLRKRFKLEIENLKLEIPFFVPEKRLCTDNAAMIAAAAFYNYKESNWRKLIADPELYFD